MKGFSQGYLAVVDEPLVSVDFRCSDVSTSIDSSLTMVLGDDLVKVVAWYGEPFSALKPVAPFFNAYQAFTSPRFIISTHNMNACFADTAMLIWECQLHGFVEISSVA
jgi:hypothetical protein